MCIDSNTCQLITARKRLVADRTAIKNRSHVQTAKLLIHQNEACLKLIDADVALTARFKILISISGISSLTACVMLPEMQELGTLDQRQVASLAGLAPHANGRASGFISGGRGNLRQALYMPSLVASRFNDELKAKYNALIAAKKPPKLALTVIMRKLTILANALNRDNRSWNAKNA